MKRLMQAPNLPLASLWAEQLSAAGFESRVLRAYASGIAGEIPVDQALPEVWLLDDGQHGAANAWFQRWMQPAERRWACPVCAEIIDGPYDTCWNCGTAAPA
jgi:hypothetical protein